MERMWRPVKIDGYSGPQIFREINLLYIHFINEETGEVVGTKLDKIVELKWWKVAGPNDRSSNGETEIEYMPPDAKDTNIKLRLVALAEDLNGKPVLR